MTIPLAIITSFTLIILASIALARSNARANDRLNRQALETALAPGSSQASRDAALAYLNRSGGTTS